MKFEILPMELLYCTDEDLTVVTENEVKNGKVVKRTVTGFFMGRPTGKESDFQMEKKYIFSDKEHLPTETTDFEFVAYSKPTNTTFILKQVDSNIHKDLVISLEIKGAFNGSPKELKDYNQPLEVQY